MNKENLRTITIHEMDIAKQIYRPWEKKTIMGGHITNHILEAKNGKQWVVYRERKSDTTTYSELLLNDNGVTKSVHRACLRMDNSRLWNIEFDMNYSVYLPNDTEIYNEIANC